MWFDDGGYILGVTVAHLHCVLIKYFSINKFLLSNYNSKSEIYNDISTVK